MGAQGSSATVSQFLQRAGLGSAHHEKHPWQTPQEHDQHAEDEQTPRVQAIEVAKLGPRDDRADVEEDGLYG